MINNGNGNVTTFIVVDERPEFYKIHTIHTAVCFLRVIRRRWARLSRKISQLRSEKWEIRKVIKITALLFSFSFARKFFTRNKHFINILIIRWFHDSWFHVWKSFHFFRGEIELTIGTMFSSAMKFSESILRLLHRTHRTNFYYIFFPSRKVGRIWFSISKLTLNEQLLIVYFLSLVTYEERNLSVIMQTFTCYAGCNALKVYKGSMN